MGAGDPRSLRCGVVSTGSPIRHPRGMGVRTPWAHQPGRGGPTGNAALRDVKATTDVRRRCARQPSEARLASSRHRVGSRVIRLRRATIATTRADAFGVRSRRPASSWAGLRTPVARSESPASGSAEPVDHSHTSRILDTRPVPTVPLAVSSACHSSRSLRPVRCRIRL